MPTERIHKVSKPAGVDIFETLEAQIVAPDAVGRLTIEQVETPFLFEPWRRRQLALKPGCSPNRVANQAELARRLQFDPGIVAVFGVRQEPEAIECRKSADLLGVFPLDTLALDQ